MLCIMVYSMHSMHDYFMHYVDFKYIVKYKQRYAKIIQSIHNGIVKEMIGNSFILSRKIFQIAITVTSQS